MESCTLELYTTYMDLKKIKIREVVSLVYDFVTFVRKKNRQRKWYMSYTTFPIMVISFYFASMPK